MISTPRYKVCAVPLGLLMRTIAGLAPRPSRPLYQTHPPRATMPHASLFSPDDRADLITDSALLAHGPSSGAGVAGDVSLRRMDR